MAERKAVNKYIPADFDPGKHGSVNGYRKSHPLRERARKLDQGILIIRFELPYNIWCNGCNNHVGMGVRYNAQKSKTGMYYSTPIYKFRMKCHLCDNHFEMETDPANLDYAILNGARRQENRWDPAENEQILANDKEDIKKMATDAMFKLEHQAEDVNKGVVLKPVLEKLQDLNKRWLDDFSINQQLRKTFRTTKKQEVERIKKDDLIKKKSCLSIDLVPESSEDDKLAALIKSQPYDCFDKKRKAARNEIINEPVLPVKSVPNMNKKLKEISEKLISRKIEESGPSISKKSLGISLANFKSCKDNPKQSMSLVPYQNDSSEDE